MANEDIAYQNKDITSKMLAENFKGKSFRVYGLDLPEVRNVLPTNIPAVKANELRLDNLFELAEENCGDGIMPPAITGEFSECITSQNFHKVLQ